MELTYLTLMYVAAVTGVFCFTVGILETGAVLWRLAADLRGARCD